MGLAILPPGALQRTHVAGKALLSAVETNDEEALNAALLAAPETISLTRHELLELFAVANKISHNT